MNTYKLLENWCNALLDLQCESNHLGIDGGIMCPACAKIHGRCGDAILPMLYMADKTGNEKYLECAKKLFKWWDNVSCHDGSFVNELDNAWKSITVFSTITLAESLIHFSHLLDNETKNIWLKRLKECADFLNGYTAIFNANINYPMTILHALPLCSKIFNDKKYLDFAHLVLGKIINNFTENMLVFGEGRLNGKYAGIDLGYNVEESLPALLAFAKITKNDHLLEIVEKSMKSHLEFMLPDGGWDNSWGSRKYKWTYWGSRTSDGCFAAYASLADKYPSFLTCAVKNLELLENCTHNGLLYGGPDYINHKEKPCVHHTFCHAKALAICLIETNSGTLSSSAMLPSQTYGENKYYPELKTHIVRQNGWNATICANDFINYTLTPSSGGTISMLYNQKTGPVIAASLTQYIMQEPGNMQMPIKFDDFPLTPMIVCNGFKSVNCFNPKVDVKGNTVTVSGELVNDNLESSNITYSLTYQFENDAVIISALSSNEDAVYHLPIIGNLSSDGTIVSQNGKSRISVKQETTENKFKQIFSYSPGFIANLMCFKANGTPITLSLK